MNRRLKYLLLIFDWARIKYENKFCTIMQKRREKMDFFKFLSKIK